MLLRPDEDGRKLRKHVIVFILQTSNFRRKQVLKLKSSVELQLGNGDLPFKHFSNKTHLSFGCLFRRHFCSSASKSCSTSCWWEACSAAAQKCLTCRCCEEKWASPCPCRRASPSCHCRDRCYRHCYWTRPDRRSHPRWSWHRPLRLRRGMGWP